MYDYVYNYCHDQIFSPRRDKAYRRKILYFGCAFSVALFLGSVILFYGQMILPEGKQWGTTLWGLILVDAGIVFMCLFFNTMMGLKVVQADERIKSLWLYLKKRGWCELTYCDYFLEQNQRSNGKKDKELIHSHVEEIARGAIKDYAWKAIKWVLTFLISGRAAFLGNKVSVTGKISHDFLFSGLVLFMYIIFAFVLVPCVVEALREDKSCTRHFKDDLLFVKAKLMVECSSK